MSKNQSIKIITLGKKFIAPLAAVNADPEMFLGRNRYGLFGDGVQPPANAVKVDAKAFFSAVKALGDEMKAQLVGLDAAVDLLLNALVSGDSLFFLSLPGSAKTTIFNMLAQSLGDRQTVIDAVQRILGDVSNLENVKGAWRKNMTPDMSQSDVLGAPSVKALQEGKQKREWAGAARAAFVLEDEFFRAGEAQQAGQLELMEERTVTTPDGAEPTPLHFFMGAANSVPGIGPNHAAWDRFGYRMVLQYPKGIDGKAAMLRAKGGRTPIQTRIELEDLALVQCLVEYQVFQIPDDIHGKMAEILAKLQEKQHDSSPRRAFVWARAVVAKAFLAGRVKPAAADLMVGEHILWITPEERDQVVKIIGGYAAPDLAFLIGVEADIEDVTNKFQSMESLEEVTKTVGKINAIRKNLASKIKDPEFFARRDELDEKLKELASNVQEKGIEIATKSSK